MNKIVIGSYLEVDSFYHKINPKLKIVLFFITSILTILISDLYTYIFLSSILFTSVAFGKIGAKNFLKAIKPIAIIFFWTLLFQILFTKDGDLLYKIGFLEIYDKSFFNSILVLFRMFILVGIASILTLSTSPIEVTHGTEDLLKPLKIFKVPVDSIALSLSIALRFIPLFFDEVERIEVAQKSKGYDIDDLRFHEKFRYYAFILVPLLLSAVKKSEDIANAMIIKGYGIEKKRSRFRSYKLNKEDFILIGVYILLIFLVFYFF